LAVVSLEFVRVCTVDDVEEGIPFAFSTPAEPHGRRVLVRTDGEFFALDGVCPHQGADLGEGIVERGILWCPVHSSGFDCRTGAVNHPPAPAPLKTYRVRIEGGDLHVSLEPETRG
jgi:3-phenylpropionate/trans-cinnamate dioxygenase ferredoxin subunit